MNSSVTTIRHLHLEPQQPQRLHALCGAFHQNIKQIEQRLGIHIHHRGYHFQLHGSLNAVIHGERLLQRLYEETAQSTEISSEMVHLMLQTSQAPMIDQTEDNHTEDNFPVLYSRKGGIRPRGHNQANYVKNILKHDISFGVGPAGTGKTYLAVAAAVDQLEKDIIKRILLVRPAVEAGESLGFLPGDLKEKIDPYLRPLYDALDDMIPADKLGYYMTTRTIEIAPLAYMRGRTLDNAFIILDESQNANDLQIKMFLTRIGANAKAIITGDPTQVDLPRNQKSGLEKASRILQNIEGIAHIELDEEDVVRHKLVKAIIKAYDKEKENEQENSYHR